MSETSTPTQRIVSLDQFRGYTVWGMFLVNFVGGFQACHYVLRHHNTFCSYADTIMPQFFFAVGFAFRLTFLKRAQTQGLVAAYGRTVRRLLGLLLVSLVVYTVDAPAQTWSQLVDRGLWEAIRVPLKRDWFQTLTHIAVTSLWILPVIRAGLLSRIVYLVASAALHLGISYWFYFQWVNNGQPNGIDGGPFGFLTWTIPTLVGTVACDIVLSQRAILARLSLWATMLMLLGYLASCGTRFYDVPAEPASAPAAEKLATQPVVPSRAAFQRALHKIQRRQWRDLLAEPPFVPPPHPQGEIGQSYRLRQWNYWMMSQRAGTISYLTFAAGFSLAVYALCYVLCDIWRIQLGAFRTFGTNALVAYVLHMMVASAVKPFMPRDVPAWYMWAGCAVFMLITYLFVRVLEKNNVYIRL